MIAHPGAPGKKRRIRRGVLRRGLLRLHRWVGLAVALWLIVQSITGCLLVFADQINAWSAPELFHHTAGDVGPQAATTAAAAEVPDSVPAGVQLPANETGVYVVTVSLPNAHGAHSPGLPPQRLVYVDPGTGLVNGIRDPNAGFTHWLDRLHTDLLQSDVLGVKGATIVGWLGVVAVVVVLTGGYLWLWPAIRKASTLFRLRRKSATVFSLDLHRLAGIVLFPLLLVTLVSGVNVTFQKQLRPIWYAIMPGSEKDARPGFVPPHSRATDPAAAVVSLDRVVATAADLTGGRVDSVALPRTPNGTFAVRVTRGWDPASGPRGRGGNLTVYVDQYDGSVPGVSRFADLPASAQLYEYWSRPVHSGTAGGMPTRILLDLIGVGTLAIIGTGVWLTVARQRKKVRRTAAISQALPVLPASAAQDAGEQSWIDAVPAGRVVVREGAIADAFYIVLAGEFDVYEGTTLMRTLAQGASFGQIGLLVTGVRTATVVARTDGELVVVPTAEFDIVLRRAQRDGLDLASVAPFHADEVQQRTATVVRR